MEHILWHNRYEEDWLRAFPLGNGRVAAMVYGGPDREILQINEESLWSGRQLQSHLGNPGERILQLLPALPEKWASGSIKGLRARGGFTVDMTWNHGIIQKLQIQADQPSVIQLLSDEKVSHLTGETGIIGIPVTPDKPYIVR